MSPAPRRSLRVHKSRALFLWLLLTAATLIVAADLSGLLSRSSAMFPRPSTATPTGALNSASVARPSREPAAPPPATVVTAPSVVTLRMRLFAVSAT